MRNWFRSLLYMDLVEANRFTDLVTREPVHLYEDSDGQRYLSTTGLRFGYKVKAPAHE